MRVTYQHVYEKLEKAVNDAIIELQTEYDIETGDCEPMLSFRYDNDLRNLAMTVTDVLIYQKP